MCLQIILVTVFIIACVCIIIVWKRPMGIALNDVTTFVINLDRNQDRLDSFLKQYSRCDLSDKQVRRLEAVDGQVIPNLDHMTTAKAYTEICEVEKSGYRTKHYQLTRGAVGCYLSHLHLYDMIADGKSPYGLIFEDDVDINPDIFKLLNKQLDTIPNDWDVLLLGCHCIVCDTTPSAGYYDTERFFLLHCYMLKKEGARKLAHHLGGKRIAKQLDSEISDMISDGKLKVYCLKDSLCKQSKRFATTIQTPMKAIPGINPWDMA